MHLILDLLVTKNKTLKAGSDNKSPVSNEN